MQYKLPKDIDITSDLQFYCGIDQMQTFHHLCIEFEDTEEGLKVYSKMQQTPVRDDTCLVSTSTPAGDTILRHLCRSLNTLPFWVYECVGFTDLSEWAKSEIFKLEDFQGGKFMSPEKGILVHFLHYLYNHMRLPSGEVGSDISFMPGLLPATGPILEYQNGDLLKSLLKEDAQNPYYRDPTGIIWFRESDVRETALPMCVEELEELFKEIKRTINRSLRGRISYGTRIRASINSKYYYGLFISADGAVISPYSKCLICVQNDLGEQEVLETFRLNIQPYDTGDANVVAGQAKWQLLANDVKRSL